MISPILFLMLEVTCILHVWPLAYSMVPENELLEWHKLSLLFGSCALGIIIGLVING